MAKWEPRLSPKQLEQYRSRKKYILSIGPRFAGKTYAFMHKVFRHCWMNNARFAIVLLTNRVGTFGIWSSLTNAIYNEWREADIHSEHADFGWSREPYLHHLTKMPMAKLRNRHGGESELMLFPVERAEEAYEKLMSTEFSGIWISEGQLYKSDLLFKAAVTQLRYPGIPTEEKCVWVDTNPPREGKKSWLYQVFYVERYWDDENYPDFWQDIDKQAHQELTSNMEVFQFRMEDNTYGDQSQLAATRAAHATNQDDYTRFVLGEFPEGDDPTLIFSQVWDKNVHVVGREVGSDKTEWEVLAPSDGAHVSRDRGIVKLVGGWDPGDVNHAWVAVQPWYDQLNRLCFDVLDELVIIKQRVTVEKLTLRVMEMRKALEEFAGFKVTWADYSDSSAMRFNATTIGKSVSSGDDSNVPTEEDHTDAAIIRSTSDDAIRLVGSQAVKKKGWQRRRANLLSQLLQERRLRVSVHCTEVIRMFEELRKSERETKAGDFIAPDQTTKHAFDALSYPISMMMLDFLIDPGTRENVRSRAIVSV